MDREVKLTRRVFAATVAGSAAALAQNPASAQALPAMPATRRFRLTEDPPFAEPLAFARKDAELRMMPYPMEQVRLLAGPGV